MRGDLTINEPHPLRQINPCFRNEYSYYIYNRNILVKNESKMFYLTKNRFLCLSNVEL
jgi:hypothetical protein